jgi:SulP family sulfate permease
LKHFTHILRAAPRSDIAVLLTCFGLTVVFDMQIAVSVGVVLAAMLFMKRMADIAHVKLMGDDEHIEQERQLPAGVLIYDIEGPLFFGAAEKAMSTLEATQGNVQTVILDMADVPVMDISGVIAMQSAIKRLHSHNIRVILAEVADAPCATLRKAGIREIPGRLWVCKQLDEALRIAQEESEQ